MRILYLYSELVGYQIPVFKTFVQEYRADVHVVNWDKKKLKPYVPPAIEGVRYYKRSEFSFDQLLELAETIDPNIIFISGWMDKGYMFVAKRLGKRGIPVVTGFDDKWKGTIRQQVGSIYFRLFLKSIYSHAWVTGPYQHEYAKKFGFTNKEIIYDMLSGNSMLFNKGMRYLEAKRTDYPKSFLYVGNFRYVKGTDILVEAYKKYKNKYRGDWKLLCIGNGEYISLLSGVPGIEVMGFSDQETLAEVTKRAGVFILPSRQDQWGVVVHEFAAAGLPMILSSGVGAAPMFLINNFNGLMYFDNSVDELAEAMHKVAGMAREDLIRWGENSYLLSTRISPATSAANFMSLVKD